MIHAAEERAETIANRSKNVGVRDWIGEWTESGREFRELENTGVFAQFCEGVWEIRSEHDPVAKEKVRAACELAGSRLFYSPGITLSEFVKSRTLHWERWLFFLKETEGVESQS